MTLIARWSGVSMKSPLQAHRGPSHSALQAAAGAEPEPAPPAESRVVKILKAPLREIAAWSPTNKGRVAGAMVGVGVAALTVLGTPVAMALGALGCAPVGTLIGSTLAGAGGRWLGEKLGGERGARLGEKIGTAVGAVAGFAGGLVGGLAAGAIGGWALLPVGFAVTKMCSWAGSQIGRQFTPPQPQ
jgi:hypothetical protein